jgi:hypothetical protein
MTPKEEELLFVARGREKLLYKRLDELVNWVYANNRWECLPLEVAYAQATLSLLKEAYDT